MGPRSYDRAGGPGPRWKWSTAGQNRRYRVSSGRWRRAPSRRWPPGGDACSCSPTGGDMPRRPDANAAARSDDVPTVAPAPRPHRSVPAAAPAWGRASTAAMTASSRWARASGGSSRNSVEASIPTVAQAPADVLVQVGSEADLASQTRLDLAVAVDPDGLILGTHFRASEEALRVLARLAGKVAGRGSRCLLQTSLPDHPVFVALRKGDPLLFLESEREAPRHASGSPRPASSSSSRPAGTSRRLRRSGSKKPLPEHRSLVRPTGAAEDCAG